MSNVNSQGAPWQAAVPTRFGSYDDVKMLCGTIMRSKEKDYAKTNDQQRNGIVPDSFDVRTAWPQCSSVSGHIRDQSSRGSCWAFGSTEAFNDRRCIAMGAHHTDVSRGHHSQLRILLWLGSGSRIVASSLEETTRTSAQERLVGRTCWPLALSTWRHPPSFCRARVPLQSVALCLQ